MKIKTGLMLFLAALLGAGIVNATPNVNDSTSIKQKKYFSVGANSSFGTNLGAYPYIGFGTGGDNWKLDAVLPFGYNRTKILDQKENEAYRIFPFVEGQYKNIIGNISTDISKFSTPFERFNSLNQILFSATDSTMRRENISETSSGNGTMSRTDNFFGGGLKYVAKNAEIHGEIGQNINMIKSKENGITRNSVVNYDSCETIQTVPIRTVGNYTTLTDVVDSSNFDSKYTISNIGIGFEKTIPTNKKILNFNVGADACLNINNIKNKLESSQYVASSTNGSVLVVVNGDSTLIPVNNSSRTYNLYSNETSDKKVNLGLLVGGAVDFWGNRAKINLGKAINSDVLISQERANLTGVLYDFKNWDAVVGDLLFEHEPNNTSITASAWTNRDFYNWQASNSIKNHNKLLDMVKQKNDQFQNIDASLSYSTWQKQLKRQIAQDEFIKGLPNSTFGYSFTFENNNKNIGISTMFGTKLENGLYVSVTAGVKGKDETCIELDVSKKNLSGYLRYDEENTSTTAGIGYTLDL